MLSNINHHHEFITHESGVTLDDKMEERLPFGSYFWHIRCDTHEVDIINREESHKSTAQEYPIALCRQRKTRQTLFRSLESNTVSKAMPSSLQCSV